MGWKSTWHHAGEPQADGGLVRGRRVAGLTRDDVRTGAARTVHTIIYTRNGIEKAFLVDGVYGVYDSDES